MREEPGFAERVRARFQTARHCTMATIRKDGSPRISGTEVDFEDKDIQLGSMAGSVKTIDLRNDPRVALHCPTGGEDSAWNGDAKMSGVVEELSDPTRLDENHLFRVDLTEVVFTGIDKETGLMTIDTWRPGKGIKRQQRR